MRFAWATGLPRPVQQIRNIEVMPDLTNSGDPLGAVEQVVRRHRVPISGSPIRYFGFVIRMLKDQILSISRLDGKVRWKSGALEFGKRGSSS